MLSILKIEIDGHFHGGEPVKPWVAEITGPDPKYGLARNFLKSMNDWSAAKKAWSGNIYGRVAHFALREGGLYEVQRCRGNSSKRHVVREFVRVIEGKRELIEPEIALSIIDGGAPAALYRTADAPENRISRVRGLGTPERLAWVVVNFERVHRLEIGGVYEIAEQDRKRFAGIHSDHAWSWLSEQEAWSWLTTGANHSA